MTRRHLALSSLALVALSACRDSSSPLPTDASPGEARAAVIGAADVQGRYIVVFRDDVISAQAVADQLVRASGTRLHHRYDRTVKGFAASLTPQALAALRRNPNVAYIEPDAIVTASATQSGATWGLDRIDQRDRPLTGSYVYNADGTGVNSYIIDTGILPTHADFGSRVISGFTAITDGRGTVDCDGHGTHVAGTVGGATWGVAKSTTLVPVRVLDCTGSGFTSGVIAGVDWVASNHVKPAVANMSLGGGISSTLDAAVNRAIEAGVTFVVAAGNSSANACNYSPARAANAITVGATGTTDARASYSNFGSCLDIFAPGTNITSAWYTGSTVTSTISGTSMAAPHVAGAAALYLQGNPTATPATVASALTANASLNKVTSAGTGSPNRLLFTGFIGTAQPPANVAPTASFTYSCTNLACSFNGSTSTDSDGTIASYAWNFGDGTSGSGASVSKSYASAGTRTVTLTVTDNAGATGARSQSVTTTAPSAGIVLSVTVSRRNNSSSARLSWTGAAARVDVFVNGARRTTVTATQYTDNIGRGTGTRRYRVCNAGTSICSPEVTVSY